MAGMLPSWRTVATVLVALCLASGVVLGGRPTVDVGTDPSPTSTNPIIVAVSFSEAVQGFTLSDVNVTGGTTHSFVGGPTVYQFEITPDAERVIFIDIPENVSNSTSTEGGNYALAAVHTIEYNEAPFGYMVSPTTDPTNANPIPVTVVWNEPVTDFTDSDITPSTGSIDNFVAVNTTHYTFDFTIPAVSATVYVDIGPSVVTDISHGLENTQQVPRLQRVYDQDHPTVSLAGPVGPTRSKFVLLTATFNEDVTGVNSSAAYVEGGSVSSIVSNSATEYVVNVTLTTGGWVNVTVAGGSGFDAAGNGNTPSSAHRVYYDIVGPSINLTSSAPNPTYLKQLPLTVAFNEPLASADELTVADFNATGDNAVVNVTTSDNQTFYAVLVLNEQQTHHVEVLANTVLDVAGNLNPAKSNLMTRHVDFRPESSLYTDVAFPTNLSSIPFVLNFSELVDALVPGDFSLFNGNITGLTGSGAGPWTFDFVPQSEGECSIWFRENRVNDVSSQGNLRSNNFNFTYDATGPSVLLEVWNGTAYTATPSHPLGSALEPHLIRATFNEKVQYPFDTNPGGNVAVNGSAGALSGTFSSTDNTSFTFTFDPASGTGGAFGLQFEAQHVKDLARNWNSHSPFLNVEFDYVAPTITLSWDTAPNSRSNVNNLRVWVSSDEDLYMADMSTDLTCNNCTLSNHQQYSPTNFSVDVTVSATGQSSPVSVVAEVGALQDTARNPTTAASNTLSFTHDTVAPTAVLTTSQNGIVGPAPFVVTVTFSENVAAFASGDLTLDGAFETAFQSTDDQIYEVTLRGCANCPGEWVNVSVSSSVCVDFAGNANSASSVLQFDRDGISPTIDLRGDSEEGNYYPATYPDPSFTAASSPEAQFRVLAGADDTAAETVFKVVSNEDVHTFTPQFMDVLEARLTTVDGFHQFDQYNALPWPNAVSPALNNDDGMSDTRGMFAEYVATNGNGVHAQVLLDLSGGDVLSIRVEFMKTHASNTQTPFSVGVLEQGTDLLCWYRAPGHFLQPGVNSTYVGYHPLAEAGPMSSWVTWDYELKYFTDCNGTRNFGNDLKNVIISQNTTGGVSSTGTTTLAINKVDVVRFVGGAAVPPYAVGVTSSSNSTLNITVHTGGGSYDGPFFVRVQDGAVNDTANNKGAVSNVITMARDKIDPNCTLSVTGGLSNQAWSVLTVFFSEDVAGHPWSTAEFEAMIDSANGNAVHADVSHGVVDLGNRNEYTFNFSTPVSGLYNWTIGSLTDEAGNSGSGCTSATVTVDVDAPTVTITPDGWTAGFVHTGNSLSASFAWSEAVSALGASGRATGYGAGQISRTIANVGGNAYRMDLDITGLPSGEYSFYVDAMNQTDLAGNYNPDRVVLNFTVDHDVPSVVLSTSLSTTSVNPTLPFTATFSEAMDTGTEAVTAADFLVTNGAVTSVVGGPTVWVVSVTPTVRTEWVNVTVRAGASQDSAGNNNTVSNTVSIRAHEQPTVTVNRTGAPLVNRLWSNFTVYFSADMTGFTSSDVSLQLTKVDGSVVYGAAAGTVQVGPDAIVDAKTYNLSVVAAESGVLAVSLASGVAVDEYFFGNQASTGSDNTVELDVHAPIPTLSVSQTSTNQNPITLTVTFDETVTGFGTGDVSITNGAVTGSLQGTSPEYTMEVTFAGEGQATFDVDPAVVVDTNVGLSNVAATQLVVDYDVTAPTLTWDHTVNFSNANPALYNLTFNEPVTNFGTVSDFVNSTGGPAVSFDSVSQATAAGDVWTLSLTPIGGDGVYEFTVATGFCEDLAGNALDTVPATAKRLAVDATLPVVTAYIPGQPGDLPSGFLPASGDSPMTVGLNFSEAVTGIDTSTLVLQGANYGGSEALVGDSAVTFEITPTCGMPCVINITYPGGWPADLSGNVFNHTGVVTQVLYDTQSPAPTISANTSNPTYLAEIPFLVDFDLPVGVSFSTVNLTVVGGTLTTAPYWINSQQQYGFKVTPDAEGNVTVSLAADSHVGTNGVNSSASNVFTITYDKRPSVVVAPYNGTKSDFHNAAPFYLNFTFSEPVTGLTTADFGIVNGNVDEVVSLSGSNIYGVIVTPIFQGDVKLSLNADAVTDSVGFTNEAYTDVSVIEFDTVSPTPSLIVVEASPTDSVPFHIAVVFVEMVTALNFNSAIEVSPAEHTLGDFVGTSTPFQFSLYAGAETEFNVSIKAGEVFDQAGNPNLASDVMQVRFNRRPNVNVTYGEWRVSYAVNVTGDPNEDTSVVANTNSEPTNHLWITNRNSFIVLAEFNEAVFNWTSDPFVVTGATQSGLALWNVSADYGVLKPQNLETDTWVTWITPTSDGLVTVDLPDNVNVDVYGMGNFANGARTGIVSVMVDRVAPSYTLTTTEVSPTRNSPITYTVTFDELVTAQSNTSSYANAITADSISVNNATVGNVVEVTPGIEYTFDVTPTANLVDLDVTVAAGAVMDLAGNAPGATVDSIRYDAVNPLLAYIYRTDDMRNPTNVQSIPMVVNFTEVVVGFEASDLSIVSGGVSVSVDGFTTADNQSFSFSVNASADASIVVSVPGSVTTDVAGNDNQATIGNVSYEYDQTAPTVYFTSEYGWVTNQSVINITVWFSEPVRFSEVDLANITMLNVTSDHPGMDALVDNFTVLTPDRVFSFNLYPQGVERVIRLAVEDATVYDAAHNPVVGNASLLTWWWNQCVDEQPCVNGACNDLHNDWSCTCDLGWNGTRCDINIDDCAPSPCQNGATCGDLVADYYCNCTEGWMDKDCDRAFPILTQPDNTSIAFTENDADIAVFPSFEIGVTGNPDYIVSGQVSFCHPDNGAMCHGYDSGMDSLIPPSSSGIVGTFSSGTGVLTLSGLASKADYQAFIRAVEYSNTNEEPTEVARVVYVQVSSNTSVDSNIVSRNLSVTSVNDDPVATEPNTLSNLQFVQGSSSPVGVFSTATLTDLDDTMMNRLVVWVDSGFHGTDEDDITWTIPVGSGIVAGQDLATVTFTGPGTLTDFQDLLQSIGYINVHANPSPLDRVFMAFVEDENGALSNTISRTVEVTPVVTNSFDCNLDAAQILPAGTASTLLGTATFEFSSVSGDFLSYSLNMVGGDLTDAGNATTATEDDVTFVGIFQGAAGTDGSQVFGLYRTSQDGSGEQVVTNQAIINPVTLDNLAEATISGKWDDSAVPEGATDISALQSNLEAEGLYLMVGIQDYPAGAARCQITAVNDAPILRSVEGSYLQYYEAAARVAVTDTLEIVDIDSVQCSSATVSFTSGYLEDQDQLILDDTLLPVTLTGSVDTGAGVLTLTPVSSLAPCSDFQDALRTAVFYYNDAETSFTSVKTLAFQVFDDQSEGSVVRSRSVQLIQQNNPTVLSGLTTVSEFEDPGALFTPYVDIAYAENDAPVNLISGLTVFDADSLVQSAVFTFLNGTFVDGEDLLLLSAAGGLDIGAIADSNTPGYLHLIANESTFRFQNALEAVTYENPSDQPTEGYRWVRLDVTDSNGGLSDPVYFRISVVAVNDPPFTTVSLSANATEEALRGDIHVVGNEWVRIAPAAFGFSFNATDADDTMCVGAGVEITGNLSGLDDGFRLADDWTDSLPDVALDANLQWYSIDAGTTFAVFLTTLAGGATTATTALDAVLGPSSPVFAEIPCTDMARVLNHLEYRNQERERPSARQVPMRVGLFDHENFSFDNVDDGHGNGAVARSVNVSVRVEAIFDRYFQAILSGETQAGAGSPEALAGGSGLGTFILPIGEDYLSYNITMEGLDVDWLQTPGFTSDNVILVHFHNAAAGFSGLTKLTVASAGDNEDGSVYHEINGDYGYVSGRWDSSAAGSGGPWSAAWTTELLAERLYIEVHTNRFPTGELRGQIVPVTEAPRVELASVLSTGVTYFTEDEGAVNVLQDISIGDVDSYNMSSVSVSITPMRDGDKLFFRDTSGHFESHLTNTTTINNLTWTVTLSGPLNKEAYIGALLNTIWFTSSSDNVTSPDRSVFVSVTDDTGNPSNTLSYTLTPVPVNDVPILSGYSVTGVFVPGPQVLPMRGLVFNASLAPLASGSEQSGMVVIDYWTGGGSAEACLECTVADPDHLTVSFATFEILNYVDGEDMLTWDAALVPAGVTVQFDTGLLSITQVAPVAQYEALMQSVQYTNLLWQSNSQGSPSVFTGSEPAPRTVQIEIKVADGNLASPSVHVNVSVDNPADLSDLACANTTTTFTEGDVQTHLAASGLSLTTTGHSHFVWASVWVSVNFFAGEDYLAVDSSALSSPSSWNAVNWTYQSTLGTEVAVTYDNSTGALDFVGLATPGEYHDLLSAVTYTNPSQDPSVVSRVLQMQVASANLWSNQLGFVVEVVAVNDAPLLAVRASDSDTGPYGSSAAAQYTEDYGPVTLFPGGTNDASVVISDVDDTSFIQAALWIGSGYDAAADVLLLDPTETRVAASWDATSGYLTLTGSQTLSVWEDVLTHVWFNNTVNNPTTDVRTVGATIWDSEGLVAQSNVTVTVTVVAMPDKPALTVSTSMLSFNEDETTGPLVASDLTIFDIDSAQLAGAEIVISANFSATGDSLAVDANELFTLGGADDLSGLYEFHSNGVAFGQSHISHSPEFNATFPSGSSPSADSCTAFQDFYGSKIRSDLSYGSVIVSGDTGSSNITVVCESSGFDGAANEFCQGLREQNRLSIFCNQATIIENGVTTVSNVYLHTSACPTGASSGFDTGSVQISATSSPVCNQCVDETNGDYIVSFSSCASTRNWGGIDGNCEQPSQTLGVQCVATPPQIMAGSLVVEGLADVAQYQNLLRSVYFANNEQAPDEAAVRQVSMRVWDETSVYSDWHTRSVALVGVADDPVLSLNATVLAQGTPQYVEGDAGTFIAAAVEVTDVDSTLSSSTVTVTYANNLESAPTQVEDFLQCDTDVLLSTLPVLSCDYDASTLTLTLSGEAGVDVYQTVMRSVLYYNNATTPVEGLRQFNMAVEDAVSSVISNVVSTTVNVTDVVYTVSGAYVFDIDCSDVDQALIDSFKATLSAATGVAVDDIVVDTSCGSVAFGYNLGGISSSAQQSSVVNTLTNGVTFPNSFGSAPVNLGAGSGSSGSNITSVNPNAFFPTGSTTDDSCSGFDLSCYAEEYPRAFTLVVIGVVVFLVLLALLLWYCCYYKDIAAKKARKRQRRRQKLEQLKRLQERNQRALTFKGGDGAVVEDVKIDLDAYYDDFDISDTPEEGDDAVDKEDAAAIEHGFDKLYAFAPGDEEFGDDREYGESILPAPTRDHQYPRLYQDRHHPHATGTTAHREFERQEEAGTAAPGHVPSSVAQPLHRLYPGAVPEGKSSGLLEAPSANTTTGAFQGSPRSRTAESPRASDYQVSPVIRQSTGPAGPVGAAGSVGGTEFRSTLPAVLPQDVTGSGEELAFEEENINLSD